MTAATLTRAALDVDQLAAQADAIIERARAGCAASCWLMRCTGKGDREIGAHLCQLLDDQPELLPPGCEVVGCTELGRGGRLPAGGWRCADHMPPQPSRAQLPPSPPRAPRAYGTATTDPLGREGDGWTVSKQTRLPTPVQP